MTADTVGGVWTYALELAAAFRPHGIQVYLATMGGPAPACDLPNVRVFESGFRLEWMEDPWDDVRRAGDWLMQLSGRLQPDLIHLNSYAHGALAWNAPVLMVGHSCVVSWWKAVHGTEAPESWQRYRDDVRRGLNAADLVVAPSRAMLDDLERCHGPFGLSRTIPNGRNAALYRHNRGREDRILTAGRLWDEAKNIQVLARAASSVRWPIYVAGENHHPGGGVQDTSGLRFLGRLDEAALAGEYARASIYAAPARYEPFGLAILEAALSGCVLVLGDVPSLRENWEGAALFVSPDNPAELAAALNSLINDSYYRAALSAKAQAVAAQFTPARMASDYFEAYRVAKEVRAESRICA